MKLLKFGLRFWIALTSVFSFFAGWVMLAHAPKPAQPVSVKAVFITPMPTLAPLQPLNLTNTNNNNIVQMPQFSVQQQPSIFTQAPSFSTGGS